MPRERCSARSALNLPSRSARRRRSSAARSPSRASRISKRDVKSMADAEQNHLPGPILSDAWWTPDRIKALEILTDTDDLRRLEEKAVDVGVDARTLFRWKNTPIFREAAVAIYRSRLRPAAMHGLHGRIRAGDTQAILGALRLTGDMVDRVEVGQAGAFQEYDKLTDAELRAQISEEKNIIGMIEKNETGGDS